MRQPMLTSRLLVLRLFGFLLTVGFHSTVFGQSDANSEEALAAAECRSGWETLFQDDFEGGLGSWSITTATPGGTGWGISSNRAHSPTRSLYANGAAGGSAYSANQTSVIVYGPFNLSSKSDAQFLFRQWVDTQPGQDILQFGASLDGANFQFADAVSGSATSWQINGFSVGNPPGSTRFMRRSQVWIGFRFSSNGSDQREGAYVDALCLMTKPDNIPLTPDDRPTLEFPINAATDVKATGAILGWTRVSGALSYEVHISTRSDFAGGSTVLFQEVADPFVQVSRTLTIPGSLNEGTTYFWRVRPRNAAGSGTFSQTFTFRTESSVAAAPSLLSPSNGATNTSTTLPLSWSPVSGASSYILEFRSTDSQVPFRRDSTASTQVTFVAPIANWEYAWRVRVAGDPQNPWSQEWTFRTGSTGPLAPVLASPPNGATDQPTDMQFTWQPAPQASSYRFQLSMTYNFTPTIVSEVVSGTSFSRDNLSEETTYFWRVAGLGAGGSFTFSLPRLFTTGVNVVGTPQLLSPQHGATNTSTTLDLSWSAVDGASSYQVEVRSTDTASPFHTATISGTSTTIVMPIAEWNYAWRVRVAGDPANPWSGEQTFSTGMTGPLAPVLTSPPNQATGVEQSLTFSWQTAPSATAHRFQLARNESFSPPEIERILTSGSTSVTDLDPNTIYFWRVSGIGSGGAFTFTRTWRFTTGESVGIAAPALLEPADGSTGVSADVDLRWSGVDGTTSYILDVRVASRGTTVALDSLEGTEASLILPYTNEDYAWRVRAAGDVQNPWSDEWSFTTGTTGSLVPDLMTPADGAGDLAPTVQFTWSRLDGASSYRFQVSESQSFAALLIDRTVIQPTTTESNFVPGIDYYWRVAGLAADGAYTFSPRRTFRVSDLQSPSQAPELQSPDDGQQALPLTPTFSWTAVDGAEDYLVELSTSLNFSGQIFFADSSTSTAYNLAAGVLEAGVQYWWRVFARNSAGSGPSSAPSSFTTYTDQLTVSVSRSFGSVENSSNYRLVALPGDIRERVTPSGVAGTDWRMFHDNGSDGNDYLVEYSNSSTFEFRPGRGFWLISSTVWEFNDTVEPVSLDEDGVFRFPLHDGWNVISNPLDEDVDWQAVRNLNGQIQDLWRWSGSYSSTTSFRSAESGEAYYFNNTTGLSSLAIPYPQPSEPETLAEGKFGESESRIGIELEIDGRLVSTAALEYASGAESGADPRDQIAPRSDFSEAWIHFGLPDHPAALAVDSRPPGLEGYIYDVTLVSRSGGPVRIVTDRPSDRGVPAAEFLLVDRMSGQRYGLEAGAYLDLKAGESGFSLIVGADSWVTDQAAAIVPEEFGIVAAYPNPFVSQSTIEFAVPSRMEGQWVEIDVFDILGRLTATLDSGPARPGLHKVVWHAESSGVARGMFFVRLAVGNEVVTRSLVRH